MDCQATSIPTSLCFKELQSQTPKPCLFDRVPKDVFHCVFLKFLSQNETANLSIVNRSLNIKVIDKNRSDKNKRLFNLIRIFVKATPSWLKKAEISRAKQLAKDCRLKMAQALGIRSIEQCFLKTFLWLGHQFNLHDPFSLVQMSIYASGKFCVANKDIDILCRFNDLKSKKASVYSIPKVIEKYGTEYIPLIINLIEKHSINMFEHQHLNFTNSIIRLLQEGEKGKMDAVHLTNTLIKQTPHHTDFLSCHLHRLILNSCAEDFPNFFKILKIISTDFPQVAKFYLRDLIKSELQKKNTKSIFQIIDTFHMVFHAEKDIQLLHESLQLAFDGNPTCLLDFISTLSEEKWKVKIVDSISWPSSADVEFLCNNLIVKKDFFTVFKLLEKFRNKLKETTYLAYLNQLKELCPQDDKFNSLVVPKMQFSNENMPLPTNFASGSACPIACD